MTFDTHGEELQPKPASPYKFVLDGSRIETLPGRVRVACFPCRRAKVKCSGQVPCRTCCTKERQCQAPPERRRPRAQLRIKRRALSLASKSSSRTAGACTVSGSPAQPNIENSGVQIDSTSSALQSSQNEQPLNDDYMKQMPHFYELASQGQDYQRTLEIDAMAVVTAIPPISTGGPAGQMEKTNGTSGATSFIGDRGELEDCVEPPTQPQEGQSFHSVAAAETFRFADNMEFCDLAVYCEDFGFVPFDVGRYTWAHYSYTSV